ncbi:MAG TPA: hypothetical protein VFW98_02075 [Gemmatimonadaceae bacterium]|nr:hypothetical protein [Gemmatimonadaceae bacterium]
MHIATDARRMAAALRVHGGRLTRVVGLAVVLIVAVGAARIVTPPSAPRQGAEQWAIADSAPCAGLTIRWAVPLAELRRVVGAGVQPAAGPVAGTGLLLLFTTTCSGSTIGGRPTGAFVSTHVIIPIAPPRAPGVQRLVHDVNGWIAIPTTIVAAHGPVGTLFRQHGFTVDSGHAVLTIEPAPRGSRAHLVLTTPGGRLEATATFADSARRFTSITGIVGGSMHARALAHGPEHSMRRSGGRAQVSVRGRTVLSGLHPVGAPVAVLDTDFAWSFAFERPLTRSDE